MRSRLDYVALHFLGVAVLLCACSRKVEPKKREWFCGPTKHDTCLCGHAGFAEEAHECPGHYDCCFFDFDLDNTRSTCECWNLGGKYGSTCASGREVFERDLARRRGSGYYPKEVHFPDAWRRSCP